jgi:hypothetical protein
MMLAIGNWVEVTARWALCAQNPFGVPRTHHHFSNPPAATRRNGCASCSGLHPETPHHFRRHGMSRPKRARNVTSRIDIRATDEEKTTLVAQTNRAALTLSEYIRRAALGIRMRSRIHTDAISDLNCLAGLQKHCLEQLKVLGNDNDLRHELNITLVAIREQVKNVISLHIEEE